MCGIVGIISSFSNGLSHQEVQTLRDMMFMDALRGYDATGLVYGTNQGDVQVHKESSPAWRFLSSKEWDSATKELAKCGKWAVGHNRAATRGSKVDKNAHPFNINDKLVLVQNGTYRGDHTVLKNTEVDTEACAHVLAEAESIEQGLKKINAAYAFVWYNVEDSTLYMIRNHERPLFLAETSSGSHIFASEPSMIYAAANRNGLTIKTAPASLVVGRLYKFKMAGPRCTPSEEDLDITYVWQAPAGQVGGAVVPFRRVNTFTAGNNFGYTTPAVAAEQTLDAHIQEKTYSSAEVIELRKNTQGSKGCKFYAEGLDYCPVNPDSHVNKQWYIFGVILAPGGEFDGVPCMWTVDCDTPNELPGYVAGNWFEVTYDLLIQYGNYVKDTYNIVAVCTEAVPFKSPVVDPSLYAN